MSLTSRSIAFVISHPYVDGLACFREPIKSLAAEGWFVDLYTTISPWHPVPYFAHENIRIIPLEITRWGAVRLVRNLVCHRPKYRWIFTVPLWSLHYGGLASSLANIPMVYISDELMAEEELTTPVQKKWKKRERKAHQKCKFTIALSEERAIFIRKENRLTQEHPIFVVPNSAPGPAQRLPSRYYQDILNLPSDKRLLLHAGSLWWEKAAELGEVAQHWNGDWVLIFQERFQGLKKEKRDGCNVRFSRNILPSTLLDYAVSSAHIGLALYGDDRIATRLMGTASGKITLYMKNALPVITMEQECFNWIEKEGCGVRVGNLEDIPHVAEYIWGDYERYVKNIRRFYSEALDFRNNFKAVIEKLSN